MYYENFDLDNIVTPVNVKKLKDLLQVSGYDKKKSQFLIDGFTNGFSLEYHGPTNVQVRSKNLKLRGLGSKTTLWNKVMKEVKAKHYAGPFEEIPYSTYIQSPVGLVPKDNGKSVRLIFHLSHPRRSHEQISVNANTPRDLCRVQYPDFSKAISLYLKAGKSCFLSKSDMTSAFRNVSPPEV